MSKKLIYGGVEVTPNDPRLPEILASIVELVQKSIGKQITFHPSFRSGNIKNVQETVKPNAILRIEGLSEKVTDLDQSINPDQIFAFQYKNALHINKDGMTIAECIKDPGFKVVNEEDSEDELEACHSGDKEIPEENKTKEMPSHGYKDHATEREESINDLIEKLVEACDGLDYELRAYLFNKLITLGLSKEEIRSRAKALIATQEGYSDIKDYDPSKPLEAQEASVKKAIDRLIVINNKSILNYDYSIATQISNRLTLIGLGTDEFRDRSDELLTKSEARSEEIEGRWKIF